MAHVGACSVLMGKPEGKRPTGKTSRRWENNKRVYLKNFGKKRGFD